MTGAERRQAAGDLMSYAREAGAAAVPQLLALLEEPAQRLEAIHALGATHSPAAVAPLRALAQDPDRATRKAARAALHRLRSAGVAIEEERLAPPGPASPLLGALASPFDRAGSQLVRLFVRGPLGSQRELVVELNAWTGVEGVGRRDLTRPVAEVFREATTAPAAGSDLRWFALPTDYAAHLLREAMKRNTVAGAGLPVEFTEVARFLPEDDPYAEPLVYRFVRPVEVKLDPTLLESAGALLDEPELAAIGLPPARVAPFQEEARRLLGTPRLVTLAPNEVRVAGLLQRAHRALLDLPTRQALRTILEETAAFFWLSDRRLAARRAVAAALALTESESGETPFSRRLVAREVLGAAASGEGAARTSGLWVP
ncbi:MAG: HEAT repeat domain-containing protein [Chloroflexi bacterium]|nr:HEAT repeat domain-containing protein [Chloroflexota bacterium]